MRGQALVKGRIDNVGGSAVGRLLSELQAAVIEERSSRCMAREKTSGL